MNFIRIDFKVIASLGEKLKAIKMEKREFINHLQFRTKQLAIEIVKWYDEVKKTDSVRVMGKQLLRSVTSVAANYRAACIARSQREFYSKMSIVVEEADESILWLELIEETQDVNYDLFSKIKAETLEILKIMATARKSAYKRN